jgi:hypothetical protein
MKARYQGKWSINMIADYCWSVKSNFQHNTKEDQEFCLIAGNLLNLDKCSLAHQYSSLLQIHLFACFGRLRVISLLWCYK